MKRLWRIGGEFVRRVIRDDLTSYAAAITYGLLFAIFPLGLALTALLSWLRLPTLQHALLRPLGSVVAPEVASFVSGTILRGGHPANPALVLGGTVGYLWGMSGALRQTADALNHAYEIAPPLRRPGWQTFLVSLALAVVQAAALIVAVAVAAAGQSFVHGLLRAAGMPPVAIWANVLRWAVLLALGLAMVMLVYRALPDRRHRMAELAPGALVAVGLWIAISLGFSLYLSRFNAYDRIYGGFGAVILLLLYMYFFTLALLLGAEVNALRRPRRGGERRRTGPARAR